MGIDEFELIKNKKKPNKKEMPPPSLTIITVVRNAENSIENTILSIINQDYSYIEYIIIDGGSTDNTLKIISKYEKYIHILISEPDNGIYDAMNKGISQASNDWINFMNAGDEFYNKNTCSRISEYIKSRNCSVFYGDHIAIDEIYNLKKVVKSRKLRKITIPNNIILYRVLEFSLANKNGINKTSRAELNLKVGIKKTTLVTRNIKNTSSFLLAINKRKTYIISIATAISGVGEEIEFRNNHNDDIIITR